MLDWDQKTLIGAYEVRLELLVLNDALTFAGLWLVSSALPRAAAAAQGAR